MPEDVHLNGRCLFAFGGHMVTYTHTHIYIYIRMYIYIYIYVHILVTSSIYLPRHEHP